MANSKKGILYASIAVATLLTVASGVLYLKDRNMKKNIGGKLVKVNYKFSKEFEN